jgi:hypothetical protein
MGGPELVRIQAAGDRMLAQRDCGEVFLQKLVAKADLQRVGGLQEGSVLGDLQERLVAE